MSTMIDTVMTAITLTFVFIFICLIIGALSIKFIEYLEDDKQ